MRPHKPIKTHEEFLARRAADESRTKGINEIISALVFADIKRLEAMKSEIVDDHAKLTGTDGFYFRGHVFTNNTAGIPQKNLQKQPVHESLRERLFEYQKQTEELQNDIHKMKQGIAVLIRDISEPQDLRDALPEVLVKATSMPLKHLSRTRPEAYTLTSQLHIQQYQKTMDLIYFYLGSRLLG